LLKFLLDFDSYQHLICFFIFFHESSKKSKKILTLIDGWIVGLDDNLGAFLETGQTSHHHDDNTQHFDFIIIIIKVVNHHGRRFKKKVSQRDLYWLVVSTPLKNISQNGNLPQVGVKTKNT